MAYLDYKVTDWKRLYIPNEKVQEVMDLLKTTKDLYPTFNIEEIEGVHEYPIDEYVEPMLVEENGGCATIEIFNDDWDSIFTNEGV